jgi:hypothetical protein
LRDENLNTEAYIGYGVLEDIFDKMVVNERIQNLFLSFPERWLNIIEQRQLLSRLEIYCPNLKSVHIKTHSVYIIQTTPNTCCYVIQDGGTLIPQNDTTIPLYVMNIGNMFDLDGMNVVSSAGIVKMIKEKE